jgi:hypothetical protein
MLQCPRYTQTGKLIRTTELFTPEWRKRREKEKVTLLVLLKGSEVSSLLSTWPPLGGHSTPGVSKTNFSRTQSSNLDLSSLHPCFSHSASHIHPFSHPVGNY